MGQGIVEKHYDYMRKLSASRWAWEALRRNAEYRRDAADRPEGELEIREACRGIKLIRPRIDQTLAERWGLAFMPDPNLNALEAELFWSDQVYPRKLTVQVSPRQPGEVCEFFERTTAICRITHFTDRVGREQFVLKTDSCAVQVRCEGLSLVSGAPVRMSVMFSQLEQIEHKLKLLERALGLYGEPAPVEKPVWRRDSLALRNAIIALDCIEAGLSQYECARILYGAEHAEADWKAPGGALKSEIKRAFRKGVYLRDGGYRDLLESPQTRRRAA